MSRSWESALCKLHGVAITGLLPHLIIITEQGFRVSRSGVGVNLDHDSNQSSRKGGPLEGVNISSTSPQSPDVLQLSQFFHIFAIC